MPEHAVVLMTAPDAAAVEESREVMLVAKTRQSLFARLEARVRELHPYDVPEIVSMPLTDGSRPYLSWLDQSVLPA